MMASGTRAHDRDDVSQSLPTDPKPPTDRELLQRFSQHHDEDAFAVLVERHGPMVLGVCRRVLGCFQSAQDAFQATFLVLVRKAGAIDRPELLANWLHGVAARTARKARVLAARRAHHERQASVDLPQTQLPEADWLDLWPRLDEELRRLPEKYRLPLILCYLHGMTNKEAAQRLGWPAGSISYRLARGREILRERLGARQCAPTLFATLLRDQTVTGSLPPGLADQTVQAAIMFSRDGLLASAVSPAVRRLLTEALPSLSSRTIAFLLAAAVLGLLAAGAVASGFTPWSGGESSSSQGSYSISDPGPSAPGAGSSDSPTPSVPEKVGCCHK
jgi:RNA polymerase sigma factor (sigma-70 family)